jgi:hypothetical protein
MRRPSDLAIIHDVPDKQLGLRLKGRREESVDDGRRGKPSNRARQDFPFVAEKDVIDVP